VEPAWELEADALGVVRRVVFLYWLSVQVLGALLMIGYQLARGDALGVGDVWTAVFLSASCFQNNGLTLTRNSLEAWADETFLLYVPAVLIILGNTCAPIAIRVAAQAAHALSRSDASRYLLDHPRRCYTHIFSVSHTAWLFAMQFAFLVLQIVTISVLDTYGPAFRGLSSSGTVASVFFTAASTRTAGLNCIDLQNLTLISALIITICMYVSTTPVTVLRASTSRSNETSGMRDQLSSYMTKHSALLLLALLAILAIESRRMARPGHPCYDAAECDLRGDFSTFKVIFEIISAYGTVGLSLGSNLNGNSFASDFHPSSQMILCLCMLLGRLRGFPVAIDDADFTLETGS
jgi:Trk-type K+ transport system membrane component